MNRRVLYALLALLVVVAVGFLALIWFDMRQSARGLGRGPAAGTPDATHGPSTPVPVPTAPAPKQPVQPGQGLEGACATLGISCASSYFVAWTPPADESCHAIERNGFPAPDPRCTPGGTTPGVTADLLRSPDWRTRCIRNCQSTEKQKHVTYG